MKSKDNWKNYKMLVYFKEYGVKEIRTYGEFLNNIDDDGIDIFTARKIIERLQLRTNIEVLNWKVS